MEGDDAMSLGLFSSFKKEASEESVLLSNSEARSQRRKDKLTLRNTDDPDMKRKRMGCFGSFFAIIKAYTTINIFILPLGF